MVGKSGRPHPSLRRATPTGTSAPRDPHTSHRPQGRFYKERIIMERKWLTALCAATALAATGPLAASASAAVSAPHDVTALYNTSGVELTGYTPGARLSTEIVRNGVTIGTASGVADAAGVLNINPTVCWTS